MKSTQSIRDKAKCIKVRRVEYVELAKVTGGYDKKSKIKGLNEDIVTELLSKGILLQIRKNDKKDKVYKRKKNTKPIKVCSGPIHVSTNCLFMNNRCRHIS